MLHRGLSDVCWELPACFCHEIKTPAKHRQDLTGLPWKRTGAENEVRPNDVSKMWGRAAVRGCRVRTLCRSGGPASLPVPRFQRSADAGPQTVRPDYALFGAVSTELRPGLVLGVAAWTDQCAGKMDRHSLVGSHPDLYHAGYFRRHNRPHWRPYRCERRAGEYSRLDRALGDSRRSLLPAPSAHTSEEISRPLPASPSPHKGFAACPGEYGARHRPEIFDL